MTTSFFAATGRRPRILTHVHRQRLERSSDHYLQLCYRQKTAVRASELASFLNVTPEYLSGLARRLTGQTLRDFLRAKQLQYAEQLLRVTPLPVDEIALCSGFGTPGTFYRCFYAKHAMTPGAFRELKK
ncbi:MAG TPA: helix-turn-helix transcriptional regulator [Thermoanaerobaculia bacterium]